MGGFASAPRLSVLATIAVALAISNCAGADDDVASSGAAGADSGADVASEPSDEVRVDGGADADTSVESVDSSDADAASAIDAPSHVPADDGPVLDAAEAGPPPACKTTTLLPEDVIAAATVALDSCVSDDGFWLTQNFLRGTRGGYRYPGGDALVQCLAAVTTGCAGVMDCIGLSPLQGGETCNACQGDVAVLCGKGWLWDCTKYGGTCLGGGTCSYPDLPACDGTTFQDSCDPTGHPVTCDDHVLVGPACSDFGLACGLAGFGGFTCVGTGAPCAGSVDLSIDIDERGSSCQGDLIDACVGGRTATLRCPCLGDGFTCQMAGGVAFCGAASECDPRTFAKTCNGTSVVFCDAGKLATVDCVALGFSSCAPSAMAGCQ